MRKIHFGQSGSAWPVLLTIHTFFVPSKVSHVKTACCRSVMQIFKKMFISKFTWIYLSLINKFTDRSYLITMIEYAVKFEDVKYWCYWAFGAQIDWNPLNSVIIILIEQMSTVLLMSVWLNNFSWMLSVPDFHNLNHPTLNHAAPFGLSSNERQLEPHVI